MPTFGDQPGDVVTSSRGDVLNGVSLSLYPTKDDATAGTNLLATVVTNLLGRWSYTHATLTVVWVRTLDGQVYSVEDAMGTVADAQLPVTAQAATLSSTYETPASTAAKFPALSNGANPMLGQTKMFDRLDYLGATVAGDASPKGCLEVYTQIAGAMHDLTLIVHGHADMHFSHAAPSNRASLVTITGVPTGGTFTLTYGGQTTTALAYNAAGTAVQAALIALSTLVGSSVMVYGGTGGVAPAGGPWTISLTIADPTALTASGAGLTGGTTPSVTVSQTVPDGQVFFDLPIGGTIPVTGTILGKRSTGQVEMQLGGTGGTFRWLSSEGALLMNINNAGILTLGTANLSGSADLPRMYGGGSSGGMALFGAGSSAGTGTSGLIRFRDNDTDNNTRFQVGTAAPTSGGTTLALAYHNGTAVTFQFVTLGAADSGGVGFKSLRVPN